MGTSYLDLEHQSFVLIGLVLVAISAMLLVGRFISPRRLARIEPHKHSALSSELKVGIDETGATHFAQGSGAAPGKLKPLLVDSGSYQRRWSMVWTVGTSFQSAGDAIEKAEEEMAKHLAEHYPSAVALADCRLEASPTIRGSAVVPMYSVILYGNPVA